MRTQDLRMNGAEVDRIFEVLGGVQVGEAGLLAVEAASHRIPDQDQRRCRTVVGAAAVVLVRPTPELGPSGDQDPVGQVVRGQVLVEGAHRLVEVGHQDVVPGEFGVVGGRASRSSKPAPQRAVDLAQAEVPGLPDPDRLEVGEAGIGIADAPDDRYLALVPRAP